VSPELLWTIIGVVVAILVGIVFPAAKLLIKFGRTLEQINHQVTRNGGKNNPPTLPDKLSTLAAMVDSLQGAVDDVKATADETRSDVRSIRSWSEVENRRLWRELAKKADKGAEPAQS
jgi:hypothetical protein